MMRVSTIAVILWFGINSFWKIYAKIDRELYDINTVNYWINVNWTYTNIFYAIIFFETSLQFVLIIHRLIWLIAAFYFLAMAIMHIYLFFNISLYDSIVSSANKIPFGAVFSILGIIYLTYKAIKNDKVDA
jgi:hypothetical protein